jgi:hypothetical protein
VIGEILTFDVGPFRFELTREEPNAWGGDVPTIDSGFSASVVALADGTFEASWSWDFTCEGSAIGPTPADAMRASMVTFPDELAEEALRFRSLEARIRGGIS